MPTLDTSPHSDHRIQSLTPSTHAPCCRDALVELLQLCPEIRGATHRVHGESGVPECSYRWACIFMHAGDILITHLLPCRTIIPTMSRKPLSIDELANHANKIRITAMAMTHHSRLGHTGGDLSSADILTCLYLGEILNVRPDNPAWPQRDRFIMSKGHCSGAYYSTLAARGFFPAPQLKTFMDPLSMLNGHPDRNKLPGIEANTGPLGHGLPIAVGAALAAKMRKELWRVFVLTGDGELQEGSNWEAAMTAQHYSLDNLVVIVDRNRIQQGDFTDNIIRMDPLADKWEAFGFAVREIDGHNHEELMRAFESVPLTPGQPTCFVACTVKGKGVSFAENKPAWHHGVPTREQLELAAKELNVELPW